MISTILIFIQSKLGKQLIIGLLITASLFIGYNYIFNRGVKYQKSLYQAEYVQTLNKLLLEQKTKQEQAFKQGLDTALKEQKTITVYKDRIVTVNKIIEKYKDCKMEDKDFTDYIKELRDLK